MGVFNQIKMIYHKRSSSAYIKYLRKKGIHIGEHCIIRAPRTARIDVSRPSLVTIGNNVDMNMNFQILTHDWASLVFRTKYNDFVNSSGHVTIGNNIYFGTNVVVLKGVTIGDNCVIGACSLVTKNIPANSVAAGVPCRVICSIDEYYRKRKQVALAEAVEYVQSIQKRFKRDPFKREWYEEFIYFTHKDNIEQYEQEGSPVKSQLGIAYTDFIQRDDLAASIEQWVAALNVRQREVVERRFGLRGHDCQTLQEIGDAMSLTRERVRQIQVDALARLRTMLESNGLSSELLFHT